MEKIQRLADPFVIRYRHSARPISEVLDFNVTPRSLESLSSAFLTSICNAPLLSSVRSISRLLRLTDSSSLHSSLMRYVSIRLATTLSVEILEVAP